VVQSEIILHGQVSCGQHNMKISSTGPSIQSGIWTVNTKNALTGSSPTFVTVSSVSSAAVAANASRKGLVLTNTSTTKTVSLGLGATAVNGSGIILAPNGVWTMDEYTYTTQAINAITTSATANLAIQEFT